MSGEFNVGFGLGIDCMIASLFCAVYIFVSLMRRKGAPWGLLVGTILLFLFSVGSQISQVAFGVETPDVPDSVGH